VLINRPPHNSNGLRREFAPVKAKSDLAALSARPGANDIGPVRPNPSRTKEENTSCDQTPTLSSPLIASKINSFYGLCAVVV
jgi:hypothetical protein